MKKPRKPPLGLLEYFQRFEQFIFKIFTAGVFLCRDYIEFFVSKTGIPELCRLDSKGGGGGMNSRVQEIVD
jgi:hypothetical protein